MISHYLEILVNIIIEFAKILPCTKIGNPYCGLRNNVYKEKSIPKKMENILRKFLIYL